MIDPTPSTRSTLRRYIPKPLRPYYRVYIFAHAMRKLLALNDLSRISDQLLADLHYGWGNEGWSASQEFLRGCVSYALDGRQPILECGSGLSTIVLGIVAQRRGGILVSLEHNPVWGKTVQKTLSRFGINSVELHIAPLKSFGAFDWYDAPQNLKITGFKLIICDGPPARTPGGRYGLVPMMRSRFAPNALILLDDAGRPDEREIAERWAQELGATLSLEGDKKPFAVLTTPA